MLFLGSVKQWKVIRIMKLTTISSSPLRLAGAKRIRIAFSRCLKSKPEILLLLLSFTSRSSILGSKCFDHLTLCSITYHEFDIDIDMSNKSPENWLPNSGIELKIM